MKNVLKHGAMLQVIKKRVIGQHGHNTHAAWRWWQYQDYVVLLTSFVSSESFTWNCAIIILFYLYVRTVITCVDWKIDQNTKRNYTNQTYLDFNYRQYPTLCTLSEWTQTCTGPSSQGEINLNPNIWGRLIKPAIHVDLSAHVIMKLSSFMIPLHLLFFVISPRLLGPVFI